MATWFSDFVVVSLMYLSKSITRTYTTPSSYINTGLKNLWLECEVRSHKMDVPNMCVVPLMESINHINPPAFGPPLSKIAGL
jgi:hypothetical protein